MTSIEKAFGSLKDSLHISGLMAKAIPYGVNVKCVIEAATFIIADAILQANGDEEKRKKDMRDCYTFLQASVALFEDEKNTFKI